MDNVVKLLCEVGCAEVGIIGLKTVALLRAVQLSHFQEENTRYYGLDCNDVCSANLDRPLGCPLRPIIVAK